MSAAPWVTHFGLSRTPFGKRIAAKDLFVRDGHAEAVARINFCVMESALGVITGDVGAGKTVSVSAAVAWLDPTRHQMIYVANPAFRTRALCHDRAGPRSRASLLKAELMAQAADLSPPKRPNATGASLSSVTRLICSIPPSSKSSGC